MIAGTLLDNSLEPFSRHERSRFSTVKTLRKLMYVFGSILITLFGLVKTLALCIVDYDSNLYSFFFSKFYIENVTLHVCVFQQSLHPTFIYCCSLRFDDKPDYAYLKKTLTTTFSFVKAIQSMLYYIPVFSLSWYIFIYHSLP